VNDELLLSLNDNNSNSLQEPLLQQDEVAGGAEDRSINAETVEDDSSCSTDNGPTEKDISLTICSKSYYLNQNVFLNLILCALYGISDSIWGGTVFVAYLKSLAGGRNQPVGNIEAVNGLASMLFAIPVGYLADRYGRSPIIKAGGVLIALTAISHIALLNWIGVDVNQAQNNSSAFFLLGGIMALWGIGGGIVSGPAQALYADSTPAGKRTKYFHYLFVCYMLSSCCGPIISIILFQTMGDDWNLKDLRSICYVGLVLEFINALLMLCFDDKKALDEEAIPEEESTNLEQIQQTSSSLSGSSEDLDRKSTADIEGKENNMSDLDGDSENPIATEFEEPDNPSSSEDDTMKERQKWIPYILFSASLLMSIGSGMTVKFFPLFFKDDIGMTPTEVQLIYFFVPLTLTVFSGLGTLLSEEIGRVQTILLLSFSGVSCLYSMVLFKDYLYKHPFVLVPVYILRTALMNSTYPMLESILMDSVPKNKRARWKSLESIAQFGWCGSAALGGFISDSTNYTFTFLITAIIQTTGIFFYLLLLPLVPKKESDLCN